MRNLYILILLFCITSCIPIKIAPQIKEDKIKIGKKFNKGLPKNYTYIFKDPKAADEFYNYINIKYDLKHNMVDDRVPIWIDKRLYRVSFFEVGKNTRILNLAGFVFDKVMEQENIPLGIGSEIHVLGRDNYYIALEVLDYEGNDALHPKHKNNEVIVKYLKDMRQQYLTTYNYYDSYLRREL
jgi:hypothetical protein